MVNVGVLGATGMVGQRFIQLLDKHPDFELTALAASSRSAGKRYEDATTWYLDDEMPDSVKDIVVCETNPDDMDNNVDIVFSSLPTEFAAKVEKAFAKDYVVASNASAHRMKKNIPLVIPEVNPEFLDMIDIGSEEEKMESETLHLLGSFDGEKVNDANFKLSASCHRVPVIDGHTEAVFVELDEDFGIDDVKDKMANFKALPQELNLFSAPENPVIVKEESDRPQPRMDRNAGNGMSVSVGT